MTNPLRLNLETEIQDFVSDLNMRLATLNPDGYVPVSVAVLRRADRKAALQDLVEQINVNLVLLEATPILDVHALRQSSITEAFNDIGFNVDVALVDVDEGDGELDAPPSGFKYLINADGAYIVNADDAYILAKV